MVTGLLQTARNMSQVGELTTAGYERLGPAFAPVGIAVYAAPGTQPAELVETLRSPATR